MTVTAGYTWNGADGEWSTGQDWIPSGPPTRFAAVTINGGLVDTDNVTHTVRDLTLGHDGDLLVGRNMAASLTIDGGTINGDLQARSQGNITLEGIITGNGDVEVDSSFGNNGNVTLGGGTITGLGFSVESDTGITIADGVTQRLNQSNLTDMQSALTIGANATLHLANTVISSEGFAGPIELTTGSSLIAGQVGDITGAEIGGLAGSGNSIDLVDAVFANLKSESFQNGNLTLTYGHQTVTLHLIGQFAANFTTHPPGTGYEGFVLSSDNTGAHPGTIITYVNNTAGV